MASKEPSIVLNTFFNMDNVINAAEIADVKVKLMSDDPASQIVAVSWISKHLNNISNEDRDRLIETLIATDVITYLCEKICCSHSHLFTSMLKILDKLSFNSNFYKSNLAKLAIQSIIRVAFIMTKKMKVYEEELSLVAYTIYVVLVGALTAEVTLNRVCDLDQMIIFLKSLNPKCSSKYVLRLCSAKVLCLLMDSLHTVNSDEETKSSLLTVFKDSLLSMKAMTLEQRDSKESEILQNSMEIICCTCAIGIRFCKESGVKDFAKEITKVMIETVIPQFKSVKFEIQVHKEILENLIECLDKVFQLRNGDKELANVLAENGYIKYFLEISYPSLRKTMSSLVSQIISELSEDDFSNGDSYEGLADFRDSVYQGIMALPSNIDIKMIVDTNLDVLLILLYHHSYKTHEYDIVPLYLMILKVMYLQTVHSIADQPIPILKATWFLFAISSLKSTVAIPSASLCYYPEAVQNLAALLQSHDVRRCYTHDFTILQHSLNADGFPVELKCEIIRLWLDFDGDIKSLLKVENTALMIECLVSTVETCSKKLVSRALEVIAELKCVEVNWAEISKQVWHRLPIVLVSCSVNTVTNVKGLLKLAESTEPDGNCLEIYEECATTLAEVLMKKELDDDLKILLIQYVYTLLRVSYARNSPAVVEFCVNVAPLLRTLRDKGCARENFELSGFCIDLLAYIIECQEKFKIQGDKSQIVEIEPLKMLVLLARSNYELYRASVRLLVILLTSSEAITPAVILTHFENAKAANEAVFAWYMILHKKLFETQEKDWRCIFHCLIAVLNFCERNRHYETLRQLCDYFGTYDLVRWTIDHKYMGLTFFDFMDKWLYCGLQYRSENVLPLSCVPQIEDLHICETEFDEIMEIFTRYRGTQ